ncbi:hypothetical protein Sfulv_10860 [Streptomyces fulvorobeus]|uniref:Uncharacterized protein n=1 Tax=Streptomyces fulvorobeus TaxID=284028 RepID=A0A7J0C185_9ACTN|nr:hypothetical protein Sfulv_10860 [Streptomyces fulvorobeus]
MQVRGGREPDADQVVGDEAVALQDGGEQGADPLVHVSGLVPLQLDGSTDRSYRHVVLLASPRARSVCARAFQRRGAVGPVVAVLCP